MEISNRAEQAWQVYQQADCLFTAAEIDQAMDGLAQACVAYADQAPLVLCVMNGGLFTTSELVKRLDFAVEVDYLHASRYRGETTGKELHWQAMPHIDFVDRTVILVDDILDEGHTLDIIQRALQAGGVKQLITVVLCRKQGTQKVPVVVEHVGLEVPDRYVFGSGMDYLGFLRNVPGIWAIADQMSAAADAADDIAVE